MRGRDPEPIRGDFRDWWEAYLRTYVERDLDAKAGWLIGQSRGIEPLLPSVTRRGYDECIDWLP